MPENIVPVVIGVAVLVAVASLLGWLLDNPLVLVGLAAVGGGGFFWWRQRRSHW